MILIEMKVISETTTLESLMIRASLVFSLARSHMQVYMQTMDNINKAMVVICNLSTKLRPKKLCCNTSRVELILAISEKIDPSISAFLAVKKLRLLVIDSAINESR